MISDLTRLSSSFVHLSTRSWWSSNEYAYASYLLGIQLILLFFLCYGWTKIKQCFNIWRNFQRSLSENWLKGKTTKSISVYSFSKNIAIVCWLISMYFARTMKIKQRAKTYDLISILSDLSDLSDSLQHQQKFCGVFFPNTYINPFLPNIPFWFPWKHQKTLGFFIFSGRSKGNIRKKRLTSFFRNFQFRKWLLCLNYKRVGRTP